MQHQESHWGVTVVSLRHRLRHVVVLELLRRVWLVSGSPHQSSTLSTGFFFFGVFFLFDDWVLTSWILLQWTDNTSHCLIYFTSWQCPQVIYYLLPQAPDWFISICSYLRTPSTNPRAQPHWPPTSWLRWRERSQVWLGEHFTFNKCRFFWLWPQSWYN